MGVLENVSQATNTSYYKGQLRDRAHALNITIRMKNVIEWVLFVKRGGGVSRG